MTPNKKNAPDADQATGAHEQVPNQSSARKSTRSEGEYNDRFAAALLGLIVDVHAPELHDDDADRTLDTSNMNLRDIEAIVQRFKLPEADLWGLVSRP